MLKKLDDEKSMIRIFKRFILIFFCFYCISSLMSTDSLAAAIVQGQFNSGTLGPNDDGSTPLTPLGFSINFFGVNKNAIYINNNGNITLDQPLSTYTPFGLTGTQQQIIAPFFADVDTRNNSSPVTYGPGSFLGRPAFGVNWIDVNCFESRRATPIGRNSFQLILVDRSDIGNGDFDIIFNYDQILWETGTSSGGSAQCLGSGNAAHAGFSNGTGIPGTFYELAGSGVSGAFLNNGPNALITNSLNSNIAGRYIFRGRNGVIPTPASGVRPIPSLGPLSILLLSSLLGLAIHFSRNRQA